MNPFEHLSSFFDAWASRDADTMGQFYATDAVMVDPTLAEPRRGQAAIVAYYREMYSAVERPQHDLLDWAARGDRVWFEWTFTTGGITVEREDFHGVSIQSFRDGLIICDDAFWVPGG